MMTHDRTHSEFSDNDTDHDLYLLFSDARYLTFRARERELQRYELTPEQARLLCAVQATNGTATPAKLSRIMLRQPHTVSALVERMEQKGLVKKVKDLDRKNMVRVSLTEHGKKAYEITTKRGPIRRIMNSLDKKERVFFQQCLEKIIHKASSELGMDREKLPLSEEFPAV
jgi:DNA-binding MarR family transcriptional regulator